MLATCRVVASQPQELLGSYVISMASHPSDVLAVKLLLKETGVSWPMRVAPLFETLSDLDHAADAIDRLLSLEQYRAILIRTRRDPTFPEFKRVSQELQEKLKARGGACVQEKPSSGGALDFATLRSQANHLKPRFDEFGDPMSPSARSDGGSRSGARSSPRSGSSRRRETASRRIPGCTSRRCLAPSTSRRSLSTIPCLLLTIP